MAKANYDTEGGNVALQFRGDIGPETQKLLNLHGFQPTGAEFSSRYRRPYYSEEEKTLLTRAARYIKNLYNTGRREYCKELLVPKQRIKHG